MTPHQETLQQHRQSHHERNKTRGAHAFQPSGSLGIKAKKERKKIPNFEFSYDRSAELRPIIESTRLCALDSINEETSKTSSKAIFTQTTGDSSEVAHGPDGSEKSDELQSEEEWSLVDLPIVSYDENYEAKAYEKPYPKEIELDMVLPVVITLIAKTYMIVEPVHYPSARGVLPATEIERDRYPEGFIETSKKYKVGDAIVAYVYNIRERDRSPMFSLRRVQPILPDTFQPVTLVVFRLPIDVVRIFEYGERESLSHR